MKTTKHAKARFKVGDWVTFQYGTRTVVAQVIEDRGPIGGKQRRLYTLRMVDEFGEPDSFELPEEDLEGTTMPDKIAVLDFLKNGGLVSILQRNTSGGHHQPRVWLTQLPGNGVKYTFHGTPALVGRGAVVPFLALHDGKVFSPKRDEVIGYLTTFGLSRAEAEEVIAAVGTAP